MWINLPGNIYNKDGTLNLSVFDAHKTILTEKYSDYKPMTVICPDWAEETNYFLVENRYAEIAKKIVNSL